MLFSLKMGHSVHTAKENIERILETVTINALMGLYYLCKMFVAVLLSIQGHWFNFFPV